MDQLAQDLRYAGRSLAKAPGFTIVAVLTLALGIGLNSAIFSVVNAVLLRPLPVAEPDRLLSIFGRQESEQRYGGHSWLNYVSYRESARTVTDVIAYSNFMASVAEQGRSRIVVGELVSDNYFSALGVRPALGRFWTASEGAPIGAAPYVVISHRYWQSQFNGAADVVGKALRLNGNLYTVVGVADESFGGMLPGTTAMLWIPVSMAEQVTPFGDQRVPATSPGTSRFDRRGVHWLSMKARLRPGATAAQARAEFEGLIARLGSEYPALLSKERVTVFGGDEVRIHPVADRYARLASLLLLGAVGLVLLVACANLANLMLARAAGREHEFAVRAALGATRTRLARTLIAESLLLCVGGVLVAVPLVLLLTAALTRLRPPVPMEFALAIAPDWRVLAYALLIALGAGVALGGVPALRAARPDLISALRVSASGLARGQRRLRSALVVAQMAVSLMLIVLGALFVRSLATTATLPLGYDATRLGMLTVPLEMAGYDTTRGGVLLEEGARRLRDVPGVDAVSLTSRLPLSINNNGFDVHVVGQEQPDDRPHQIDGASVDEHYLTALSLPLLAGRDFVPADRDQSRRVVIVTAAFANRFWPGAADLAIGRTLRFGTSVEPYQIIGVVRDHTVDTPGESPTPYLLLPFGRAENYGNYVVKTSVPAAPMITQLEAAFHALEPDAVFMDRGTLRDLADARLYPLRAGAWLIGACGLLALLVAAVGLYGVVAYTVSQRMRELGIRAALGAAPALLLRLVIRDGMALVALGAIAGTLLALGAGRLLAGVLEVSPFDPLSFVVAIGVLGGTALVANAVPAWRASRVDPAVVLREG